METPAISSDVLRGISQIINVQNVQSDIDYTEIEKMYLGSAKKEEKHTDPTESFKSELKELADRLNLSFDTPITTTEKYKTPVLAPSPIRDRHLSNTQRTPRSDRTPMRTPDRNYTKTPIKNISFELPDRDYLKTPDRHSSYNPPDDDGDNDGDNDDDRDKDEDDNEENNDYGTKSHSSPFISRFSSGGNKTELERRTDEQIKHEQIHDVMNDMGAQNTTIFTLEQTRRQDEKLTMLDEINSLKLSLEEDEAKGIENIPNVTSKSSYEEVENVLKSYRLINDRMRYCSLADEFILWGAQGMEELFNGKRTWFGRYNPDLGGWSKQVSVKLRRMRHETSQLVGGVMHDYNIGPGMRIILELIPNMFMYARTKKQNYGKATLMNDSEISRVISDIRNYN